MVIVLAAVAYAGYNGSLSLSGSYALDPVCTSGNCTFDAFSTLGVCSECVQRNENIITDCTLPNNSCQYTFLSTQNLTTGYYATSTGGLPIYTALNISSSIDQRPFGIFNVSSLFTRFENSPDELSLQFAETTAMECGVYLCVKAINSTISNGTLAENVTATNRIDESVFDASAPTLEIPFSAAKLTGNGSLTISPGSLNM